MRLTLYIAAFLLTIFFPAAAGASIEEFVKNELSSMLPWERAAVEVDEVEVPGFVSAKGSSIRLEAPKRPIGPGKVSFKIEVREKGHQERVFWGTARVRVFKQAVVALRPLKARTKITADDITLARVELSDATGSFGSIEELGNMEAKRPISAGAVIKTEYVKKETVIRRGEKVLVMVEGPSIRIRSQGIAREDGHVGATIAVRTASGKDVPGQVTGPGEIVMGF